MITTAYESTAAKNNPKKDLYRPLMNAKIREALHPVGIPGFENVYLVIQKTPETETIPTFTQPLVVGEGRERFIAMDMRGRQNKLLNADGVFVLPKSGAEWVMIKQALLQKLWLDNVRDELYLMSDLPIKVYSRWLAERISTILTLNPLISKHLQAAAAWWYICQHYPAEQMGESEYLSKSIYIGRMVMIPNEDVYDIISTCGYITDANDFIVKSKQAIDSSRYQQITTSLMFSALAGSWFSARETAGVAIEFPPTFLALLHSAVNERSYRDTPIAKIAERLNQRQAFNQFNVGFNQIVFAQN